MNNIIIRTAKKDYVCSKCNRIIKKDSEYLDRVLLNNGNCVQHDRYHDECPADNSIVTLTAKLLDGNGLVPITKGDNKFWFAGVSYDYSRQKMRVLVEAWNHMSTAYVLPEDFVKEYSYD